MSAKARLVVLLALVTACTPAPTGPACFVMPAESGGNPLLAGHPLCFENEDGCLRARDGLASKPACNSTGPARWHCHAVPTAPGDPLAGTGTCLPARSVCEQSVEAWGSGTCTPATTVFCARHDRQLACYPNQGDCERAEAVATPPARCEAR